jgi:hypothetical protein
LKVEAVGRGMLFYAGFLLDLLLDPKDGSDMFLLNVG